MTVSAYSGPCQRILVNTKVLNSHTTGVQRYLTEVLARRPEAFPIRVQETRPKWTGLRGHIWEQTLLPIACRKSLLWSPANTGPLACRRHVLTVHDLQQLEHPEWFTARFAAYYSFVIPRVVRRASRIMVNSDFTRSRLVEVLGVALDRIVVTPLGVDGAVYYPWPAASLHKRLEKYDLQVGSYVLYAGSLQPRKNLPALLRAWRAIGSSDRQGRRLAIVGRAESTAIAAAPQLFALPDDVLLLGHVPDADMPCLYSGAISLVNLSLYEGFGLPAIEAMACGTPVLVSNTTAFPEVVGNAGVLVSPWDDDAIAGALAQMLSDATMRARLSLRGLSRASGYTWERTAQATWATLAEEALA